MRTRLILFAHSVYCPFATPHVHTQRHIVPYTWSFFTFTHPCAHTYSCAHARYIMSRCPCLNVLSKRVGTRKAVTITIDTTTPIRRRKRRRRKDARFVWVYGYVVCCGCVGVNWRVTRSRGEVVNLRRTLYRLRSLLHACFCLTLLSPSNVCLGVESL